jgi:hypothetical protein
MIHTTSLRAAGIVVILAVIPAAIDAQVRASEQGTVSQVVNGTRIVVDYARPQLRGRDSTFGRLVHFGGAPWTPGANWATTLEVDRDVTIEGKPLPRGKYSMWFTTRKDGEWTLSLSRTARLYHVQRPAAADEALRVPVAQETGPRIEVLTFTFPRVTAIGTQLRMQWGTTVVPISIGVTPGRPAVLAQAEADRYTGAYRLVWNASMGMAGETTLRVTLRDGALRGHLPDGIWGGQPDFDLIRESRDSFRPLLYRDGKPYDAEDGLFEFTVVSGQPTEVRITGIGQEFGRGKRAP